MNEGIHLIDGLIFIALCFVAYMTWKFIEAHYAIKEIEKKIEDKPIDWYDEEDW